MNVHKNIEISVSCTFAKIFAPDVSFGLCFIFPSCYSVTAGRVAMATTTLKRAKLFPNSGLKENRRQKQVSLHSLLGSDVNYYWQNLFFNKIIQLQGNTFHEWNWDAVASLVLKKAKTANWQYEKVNHSLETMEMWHRMRPHFSLHSVADWNEISSSRLSSRWVCSFPLNLINQSTREATLEVLSILSASSSLALWSTHFLVTHLHLLTLSPLPMQEMWC